MVTGIQQGLTDRRPGRRLAACMMLATVSLLAAAESRADEPAGTITLSRDIPGRNAFRDAAPAAATKVATAREDVVVATTGRAVHVIASLPDSALESVAWQAVQGNGALPAPSAPALGPAGILGNTVGHTMTRVTGPAIGGAVNGLTAGAASRPLSSIAAPLSSTLGAR